MVRTRRARALPVLLLVASALLTGCGGSGSGGTDGSDGSGSGGSDGAQPDGYAERVQAETDDLAAAFLPAVVRDLGVQVFPGRAGFVECDLTGWRYQADLDLFGATADPAQVPALLEAAIAAQGLEVTPRDDGRTGGRRGELSLLVDAETGPPGRTFRHVQITHGCTRYSEADATYAETSPKTDYAGLVPPAARYTP